MPSVNRGPNTATSDLTIPGSAPAVPTVVVSQSRALTPSDDGATLECTATVTLSVPWGLPASFGCAIIPSGTTTISSLNATLLNGATTDITRIAASNAMFAIIARASVQNSYVVTGS